MVLILFQSETEWQSFQRHCLEIVAKLAELLPGETFSLLVMNIHLLVDDFFLSCTPCLLMINAHFEILVICCEWTAYRCDSCCSGLMVDIIVLEGRI